jgi:RNA polymerase sigma-70 factor (ECF subfamily)
MQGEHTGQDLELLEALRGEHTAAFAWAVHCCDGNRADAEDVLQTVYLRVLEGRARFAGRSVFRTWLFAVVRMTARETKRIWWRRLKMLNLAHPQRDVEEGDAAAHSVYRSEMRILLEDALKRLSRRQRELLHLTFYQEMTIEQSAEVLGISAGSARVHYERGKGSLRKRLEQSEVCHVRPSRRRNQTAF